MQNAPLTLFTGTSPPPAIWLDSRFPAGVTTTPFADGAAVSAWADISGNGRDATQAVSANQAAYATSPIGMTWQSADHMTVAYPGTVMRQYYVVAKASALPGSGTQTSLIGGTAAGQLNFGVFGPGTSLVLNLDNTVVLGNPSFSPGTADFQVYSFSYANPGAWVVRAAGSQLATGTSSSTIGSNLAIRIGNTSGGTTGWQGVIAAVLAYPAVHDAATCFRIEKYLAGVYGATFPGL